MAISFIDASSTCANMSTNSVGRLKSALVVRRASQNLGCRCLAHGKFDALARLSASLAVGNGGRGVAGDQVQSCQVHQHSRASVACAGRCLLTLRALRSLSAVVGSRSS
jgi:hypothetical protein